MDTTGLWVRSSFAGTPTGYKEAIKVFDNLKKSLLDTLDTFPFAGIKFSTTDIVQNKKGEKFMVKSTANTVSTHNNILLVPVKKAHLKR